MANFDRQGRTIDEIREAAGALIDALSKTRTMVDRWNALGSTFLDTYFSVGPGTTDPVVAKQELLDALASFATLHAAFSSSGHATNLHKVRN